MQPNETDRSVWIKCAAGSETWNHASECYNDFLVLHLQLGKISSAAIFLGNFSDSEKSRPIDFIHIISRAPRFWCCWLISHWAARLSITTTFFAIASLLLLSFCFVFSCTDCSHNCFSCVCVCVLSTMLRNGENCFIYALLVYNVHSVSLLPQLFPFLWMLRMQSHRTFRPIWVRYALGIQLKYVCCGVLLVCVLCCGVAGFYDMANMIFLRSRLQMQGQ